ncbi:uncharacterized protein LAESUDRAFT_658697 [Laetiporus sulphureus 93-53]|uniref:YCII-related domain-containing protein n=1 Tax=Laetiporus sulphureus 93-53 TaxID=1314785 RepID=A0A165D1Q1_9APHY|nr:uncharacterized protein LAESUDRAFT_658697 [Laetiporus sulphureus 93-53]KZT03972.1 hypothetical protein LAESUDRAFT_658697 [Laetiporus sulphureus 93-53]
MATASKPILYKFIVWAPDMSDPDAFQRRLSVRQQHFVRGDKLHESGQWKVGGALLTPESIASPNAEKKMIGSVIICEAESLEAVREVIESDIYYTANVWDKEKLQIFPFLTSHL